MTEAMFLGVYGSPLLQAAVGLAADSDSAKPEVAGDPAHAERRADLEMGMERGGFMEAGASFASLRDARRRRGRAPVQRAGGHPRHCPGECDASRFRGLKSILRQQAALLRADETRAMAAIPAMLPPDPGQREKVIDRRSLEVDLGQRTARRRCRATPRRRSRPLSARCSRVGAYPAARGEEGWLNP